MDLEAKQQIARFRFAVIADLVGHRKLTRGEKRRILKEKTAAVWEIPFSPRTRISVSTVLLWLRRYETSGGKLESLYPDERADKNHTRALDEETAAALVRLKKEFRGATVPSILREARVRGVLAPDFRVSMATLYRFFHRQGLDDEDAAPVDRRRFEAELPNDIWQSDAMHAVRVSVDGKLRKSYLFAFLDDMSRLVPHAEFYLQERIESYTDALRKALSKRGLPRKLYVDNGPTFSSKHLGHVTASLGIVLVHSKPYQPEGRGKIERWFKTVRQQFLSSAAEGMPLQVLNRDFSEWLDLEYHATVHSSTRETPLARYLKHVHLVREAPKDLDDYFRKRAFRQVYKDRSISLDGRLYEAPVELIGKRVSLLYHDHDPSRVEVQLAGTSFGLLVPLDVQVNCRVRRDHHLTEIVSRAVEAEPPSPPPCAEGALFQASDDEL